MGVGAGWYYDSLDGMIVHQNLAESLANSVFPYYHGPYATEALAVTHKGVKGPPSTTNASVGQQVGTAVGSLTGVSAIGDFFNRLEEKQTWTRVGEVLLGGILVYAGVRALTSGSPAIGSGARSSATKPVKRVVKTAASVAVPEARLASRAVAKKTAPKTTARVAAHREQVRVYGGKRPFKPPPPRAPRQPTVRVSHIYHHKGPAK
jgi:hypothetical protein